MMGFPSSIAPQTEMSITDRREYYRLPLRVPVFIKGIDRNGDEFFELTQTVNVSASGACLFTKRDIANSTDLLVSIPAPVIPEAGVSEDHDFKFPAKVVRQEKGLAGPSRRVSVRFTKLLCEET
jgi:c-di-GMP-binding flagellar brake protein YcgR